MTKIDDVIAYGLGEVGKPYVYGAEGPSTFDCSGLMQWIFAHVGISLPRTADQQYRATSRVSSPLPGDLVFYLDPAGHADHVGLYLGAGKILDAPHTGAKVQVQPLFTETGHTRAYGRVSGAGTVTGAAVSTVANAVGVANPLSGLTSSVYGIVLEAGAAIAGGALVIAGLVVLSKPGIDKATSEIEGIL